MNSLLILGLLVVCMGIVLLVQDGPTAVIIGLLFAVPAAIVVTRQRPHGNFLLRLFCAAFLIRIIVGTLIYVANLQAFFGGDAVTYDQFGWLTLHLWQGIDTHLKDYVEKYYVGGGWGMLYLVAGVYAVIGRNPLAIQFISAVAGAATAPAIFFCALRIFQNIKVARLTALITAFYPSLILWSSQGLKDGLIVFLLSIVMLLTLKLGEQFTLKSVVLLGFTLLGLLSLRFYIFYMVVAAIGGSLVIGMRTLTANSMIRQLATAIIIGLFLTYFGVLRTATQQFEAFGNLDKVQTGRLDQVQTASSSFGKDVDVSTTSGALSAIPMGMTYLLFAPFPWQLANLRQSLTLPEMLMWWASVPFLVLGLWFTLKFRLRQALPILMFSMMLTLSYSIFQGNVGTAYRQRSQLLVFYFIFASVGFTLMQEVREEKKRRVRAKEAEQLAKVTALRQSRAVPGRWREEPHSAPLHEPLKIEEGEKSEDKQPEAQ
ncbi:MAG TPA: glycosyltransferase family 39 protein [Pyrinomonadaceae bacterium]|jgi:4-amino-4-deoxy-L-arabinose transferase-like glycosyltransferase